MQGAFIFDEVFSSDLFLAGRSRESDEGVE